MKRVVLASALALLVSLAFAPPAVASPGPVPPFAVQQSQLYELPIGNQAENDSFGEAVDVEGDVMAVGAPADNGGRGAVFAYRRVAGVWSDPVRLDPGDVAVGDRYGESVSVDGDRIVVGSPNHDTTAVDAGAVYIWKWNSTTSTWTQQMTHLTGTAAGDRFGFDVAIDTQTTSPFRPYLAIGAPGDDDKAANAGTVVVYYCTSGSWFPDGVVYSPIGSADDELGYSVDIDATNDLIIVAGAPFADEDSFLNCGKISMFDRDTGSWSHHTTESAPDAQRQTTAWFGWDVAISDRRIVAGAPMKSIGGLLAGEAYTFVMPLSLWQPEETLVNPNASSGDDQFGISVAIEKNTYLVGAFYEDGYQGAVYPFTRWYGYTKAWPKLSATGPSVTHFGTAVALSQGTIVGGAQLASSPDTVRCGGAYVFSSRGTITGSVRDADDGTLLPGKEVYALPVGAAEGDWQAAATAVVDGSGNYTLSVDTGTYIVLVQDPDGQYNQCFYTVFDSYSQGIPVMVNANANTPNINFGLYRIGAVYRFYRPSTGTHFYTPNVAERNNVIATLGGTYVYEGIAYVTDPATDTNPLERFYNFRVGSHFYTADPVEAANVKNNLKSTFSYDGPTYGVSLAPAAGKRPVYRFYNLRNGSHFYTASETERQTVQDTLGGTYKFEGPAFYIDN